MAETKYGKLIVEAPITQRVFANGLTLNANKYFPELKYWLRWNLIPKPWIMEPEPHSHDFDQVWHIFGADSESQSELEQPAGEGIEPDIPEVPVPVRDHPLQNFVECSDQTADQKGDDIDQPVLDTEF